MTLSGALRSLIVLSIVVANVPSSAAQTPPATAAAAAGVQVTRVSVTSAGDQLGGDSASPAISPDGRFVAFTFNATILGLHDNQTGATIPLGPVTGAPRFTRDGRYVVYHDGAGLSSAYDVTTGVTRSFNFNAVSFSDDLRFATYSVSTPYFSSAFFSSSFVRDTQTGQDTPVPPPADPNGWFDVAGPVISPTGRYVAYSRISAPPAFTAKNFQLFLWDRSTGALSFVLNGIPSTFSRDERSLTALTTLCGFCTPGGALIDVASGNAASLPVGRLDNISISANGRFVVYVAGHAYVLDRVTGQSQQVDLAIDGGAVAAVPSAADVDDAGNAAFASNASNLVARDTNGTSDVFVAVRGVDAGAPTAPRSLTATTTSGSNGTTVMLTWTPPTSGTPATYIIEAGSGPGLADRAAFATNSTATQFSTVVGGNAVYYVRVRAANAAGQSGPSNEVTVTVGGSGPVRPSAPINLSSSVQGSTVTLTWQAPVSGDPATTYIIQAGSQSSAADLANVSTNSAATVFSATGVSAGTYFVRVLAVNAAGVGPPSNEIEVVVSGDAPCSAPPGPPLALSQQVNGSTVTLQWSAGTGTATSYVVEAGSAFGFNNLANFDTGSAATVLTVSNVPASFRYFVRVRGRNACGTGLPSNEIMFSVP